MAYDPFHKETAISEVADRLTAAIKAGEKISDSDLETLIKNYRRLDRETRRLVRLSDLSQQKLHDLSKALEERNAELADANQALEKDLDAAAEVQLNFLPAISLEARGAIFESLYVPSLHLSGDTFHYEMLDDESSLFYVADVCGHGVPAALNAVTINAVLTAEFANRVSAETIAGAELDVPSKTAIEPARIVAHLNRHFLDRAGDKLVYFTLLVGSFDPPTGAVTLCHAGVPYPILVPANGPARMIEDTGLPVGMFDDGDWSQQTHMLERGDRLYMSSDGIVECPNAAQDAFGTDRLIEILESYRDEKLSESLSAVRRALVGWHGAGAFPDDISMIALELTDPASE